MGRCISARPSILNPLRWAAHAIGIAPCALALNLFGCAPAPLDVVDGADGGQSANNAPSGGSASGGGGAGGGLNGGSSNSGGSSVLDRSTLVTPVAPTLFVADPTIGVMSFAAVDRANGDVAPTTFIDSFERLRQSSDQFPMTAHAVCVDRVGTLIVNDAAPSLRFYNNAAAVSGIPAPNREIGGLGSRLADPRGMAYDRANDRLLVATGNRVLVFEGATLAQNGEVAPTRLFTSPDLPGGESIALAPNGDLYVADLLGRNILVFASAGLRTGSVSPDRVIESPINADVIAVDSADRLYVASGDRIAVLRGASTLDGAVASFSEMRLSGVAAIDETFSTQTEIAALVVDSRGIGYVGDVANGAVQVLDAIATKSGEVDANRAITGPSVTFDRPFELFLWE